MEHVGRFHRLLRIFLRFKGGKRFLHEKNHSNFEGPYLKFFNTSTIRGIAILKLGDLPSIFCLGPKRLTFPFEFLQPKQEKTMQIFGS